MAQHVYSKKYYDYIDRGSMRSAQNVIPLILEMTEVRSVVDVGCGRGAWLEQWRAFGVEDYLGVDGEYVDREKLPFDPSRFVPLDLSRPFDLRRRFDLVQCLEVAEHLPEYSAQALVESLTRHSDIIFFSAATIGQGGEHHINEKPMSFWVALFNESGYRPVDTLRHRLRNNAAVEPWYRYNSLLYIRASHPLSNLAGEMDWRDFKLPLSWRMRDAVLSLLPSPAVTRLARLKHSFVRAYYRLSTMIGN